MAPTIQNGNNTTGTEVRPQRPIEKKSELIARVKYCNTLPDIPFDLKYITYPFANDRFVQYNPTSLERNYKYEVLTEHDLGVTIDLINRDLYQSDPNTHLDPADERLLEEEVHTPQDSQRSRHHAKSVSWLRKSEYISTEQTRFQPQNNEKVEAKVGFNVRKSFVEETLYMDREAQIKSIEKTFEENKKPITRHYSKPNVTPMEICPVYPDFANWKYPFAQVIFDSDPAPANTNKHVTAQMEEMSQAMIRGVMDESGEQFVAYFLPTEETMEKRRMDLINEILYEDDQEYEYKMAREYNWNVKSKASKGYEENYFLIMRQDGVYYNELETRVRLNKRRQNIGQQPNNTKLVIKHVPLNASEDRMQRYREKQLEPPCEDEEIEEIEEHEITEQPKSEKITESQEVIEVNEKTDGNESDHSDKSHSSRSRTSRSRSPSSVHSRHSRSDSERSRSGSRSSSNRSRSGSATSNHSGSARSRSGSRSRSNSRSRSGTPASNRSGSVKSGSRSPSPASNRSGSARSRSRSRSSRSRSHSGSAHSHHSRSGSERSRSGSRSGSGSPNSGSE
ncbi:RNA polymerase II-associated factor 1 homolog [Contarinia nasturtii]|uniref:RNA polymerase II-associated factor 1 homolog n=1 Tax=Contarinia nasturtii TaxID=265458 RepID=UPI0012D49289|nr:RNA polymerase II-associated factor 1 homolog [Contarinia nasturtii]